MTQAGGPNSTEFDYYNREQIHNHQEDKNGLVNDNGDSNSEHLRQNHPRSTPNKFENFDKEGRTFSIPIFEKFIKELIPTSKNVKSFK